MDTGQLARMARWCIVAASKTVIIGLFPNLTTSFSLTLYIAVLFTLQLQIVCMIETLYSFLYFKHKKFCFMECIICWFNYQVTADDFSELNKDKLIYVSLNGMRLHCYSVIFFFNA